MSLFGAMTTAISGLTAQSRALGNVSDNIANSQTIGFKRVDTNFVDYLTESSRNFNAPGTVVARPDYTNTIQGTVQQSDNPLAMAISGQGFFNVSMQNGVNGGQPTFDGRPMYTRAGDFRMNQNGYLVNGSGYYLNGWSVSTAGVVDRTTLSPIQITEQVYSPVATSQVTMAANLPATPPATPVSTQVQVYDALGTAHTVSLTFTSTGTGTWTLGVNSADDITAAARGTIDLAFGTAATPAVTSGTLGALSGATGSVASAASGAGNPATLTFTTDFGQGAQTVTLDLGLFAASNGLTQYAGTEFSVHNLSQDGVPPGAYSGVSIRDNGDIAINYDNGQSRVIARVPLASFPDADKLQRLDGQAFMATQESGSARVVDIASNGVGKVAVSSLEEANVDIAAEFSKLIVAQRAYTANTRIVTTSDELLQDTINMKR